MLRALRSHIPSYRRSTQVAVRNNSTAFGYSIAISGSLAILNAEVGAPGGLDVLLFALGAVAAFSLSDLLATEGFRRSLSSESPELITHAASISFASVGGGLGSAWLTSELITPAVVWPLAAFAASVAFVLTSALELTIAEAVAED